MTRHGDRHGDSQRPIEVESKAMTAIFEARTMGFQYAENMRSETLMEARILESEATAYVDSTVAQRKAELENSAPLQQAPPRAPGALRPA